MSNKMDERDEAYEADYADTVRKVTASRGLCAVDLTPFWQAGAALEHLLLVQRRHAAIDKLGRTANAEVKCWGDVQLCVADDARVWMM
jgi:hypothetical protein